MSSFDSHVLRAPFDTSPELYDRTRPVAPRQAFDDLVALARLEPGAHLVEIGCGTGQATLPLAERGFSIVGIELGEQLADLARLKLAPFAKVRIITSSFEEWDPSGERFEAVVCVNAFHWVDPDVRFAKSADVLRDGGALAVIDMHYVTPDDADPVWVQLEADYEAVTGESNPPPHPDAVQDRSGEFEASGYFRNVVVRRYLWTISFEADFYIALLSTSSWHRKLDEDVRRTLFERIHRRIQAQPDQTLRAPLLARLCVADRV